MFLPWRRGNELFEVLELELKLSKVEKLGHHDTEMAVRAVFAHDHIREHAGIPDLFVQNEVLFDRAETSAGSLEVAAEENEKEEAM